MDVLDAARAVVLVAECAVGLLVLYLCVVAAAAVVATLVRAPGTGSQETGTSRFAPSFAIIVPAHDEERMLGALLDCLGALAYPRDRYMMCVVADNCSDSTAAVARSRAGVHVYERADDDHRGKGYALRWILDRLESEGARYDAYLILDADAVVEPGVLAAFARALAGGAQAAQGRYLALNPRASASAALRWIALALANYVRPYGRYTLGASASITGNGFCLTRDLVRAHPWSAFGLTEDYQYYLSLAEAGVKVAYAPDALILSAMPTTFSQLHTQDVRWESTAAGQTPLRVTAGRLLWGGLRARDLARLEALVELITPPLSLLGLYSIALVVAAALLHDPLALGLAVATVVGLVLYVSSAFVLRPPAEVYRALLYAPWYALRKIWILLVVRRRKSETSVWARTSREESGGEATLGNEARQGVGK